MPYIAGLTLGFSLIMAIGSQNIYVIKQGILRQYSLCCALMCGVCDALLIILSVTGAHQLIVHVPFFNQALLIMGTAFLLCYGGLSIKRAIQGKTNALQQSNNDDVINTRWKTMLIALSFSLLNPHAFIDTFIVMGGMATHIQQGLRWEFALGAVTASFIWFFVLVMTAMYLAPVLQRKTIWRGLEFLSGCLMIYIAVHILFAL